MFRDASLSYRCLPLGLYENEFDHRYEQRGEVCGMYRLRAFEMHNIHTVAADEHQAFEIFKKRFDRICEIFDKLGLKPDGFIFFVLEELFNETYRQYLIDLAKKYKVPVVIELLSKVTVYMHAWIDYLVFDSLNRPMEVGTAQVDSFSAKYWNIKFKDKDNKDKHPFIVHAGFGAERSIAAMLEIAARKKNPTLPLWISPIQVRLCPVNDELVCYAEELASQLEKENIRVDIDDRAQSIPRKVRDAEVEWVPYIVVVGQKEKESGKLAVRTRADGKVRQLSLKELVKEIKAQTAGLPFKRLPISKYLSQRPTYI